VRQAREQLVDLVDQVSAAKPIGGGQTFSQYLPGGNGLSGSDQLLGQCEADYRDTVGSLQLAQDLERLKQPGEG
jgi:hypothetical protein